MDFVLCKNTGLYNGFNILINDVRYPNLLDVHIFIRNGIKNSIMFELIKILILIIMYMYIFKL